MFINAHSITVLKIPPDVFLIIQLTFSGYVRIACWRAVAQLSILYRSPVPLTYQALTYAGFGSLNFLLFPSSVWQCQVGGMKWMQRVQNMCVSYVCRLRKFEHVSLEVFPSMVYCLVFHLCLLPMDDLVLLHTSCLTLKFLTEGKPLYLRDRLRVWQDNML
jgi:hypothetical protein